MTPTLVLLQMQPSDSPLPPLTAQPKLKQPFLGQAWNLLADIIDRKVGHIPLYVMSLNRQGVVGAWDVGKKQEGLDWSSGRHLVGNPMVRLNLQGPMDASEMIVVCGDESFRHVARSIIRDIDFGRGFMEFNAAMRNVRSANAGSFHDTIKGLMSEGEREERARLFQQLDVVRAMHDGRLPDDAEALCRVLEGRLAKLNEDLEETDG